MNIGKRPFFIFVVLIVTVLLTAIFVSATAADVTGTWKMTVESQAGTGNPTVTLKQDGEMLTGNYKGQLGEAPLKGTLKGSEIKFSFSVNAQGQDLLIEYTGTVEGKTMKGKVKLGDFGEGTFTGVLQ
ncbi:MAG: hypothetical protein ABI882_08735 [Acidobacteriota bacterium]